MSDDSKKIAEELLKLLKKGVEEEKGFVSREQKSKEATKSDKKAAEAAAMQQELNKANRDAIALQEQLAILENQRNANRDFQVQLDAKIAELETARLEGQEDLVANLEEEIALLEIINNIGIDQYYEDIKNKLKETTEATVEYTKSLDDLREAQEKLELKEYNEAIESLASKAFPNVMKNANSTKNRIGNLGDTFTKSGDAMKKMGGMTGRVGGLISKAGGKLTSFSESLSGGALVAFAVAKELFNMALALDDASRKLGAATGFGNVFSDQLLSIQKAGNMAGIGVEQASSAITAMANGLSSFNPTADETNAHVGLTIARMEKLGVASAASVKSIEHMQRSMGMTAKQAADATANLALMGKEIGVTGTKMINDFNAASGRMAIYGKDNIKMFKQLAAAAKASGIEMQTLIGISKKFDDFSGAADSISQLNAVLGTNLSTMEMMGASDAERVMMIKQQVQMSVGNFDSLDKYTKMYVAQAMGVSDVAEAQKLLNMSQSEYMRNQAKQKEQADIQGKLAENSEAMVGVMQQLKLATSEFFLALSPIISGIATLLSMLSSIAPVVKMISKALVVLAAVWLVLNIAAGGFAGIMTALGWTLIVGAVLLLAAGLSLLYDGFVYLFNIFKKKFNPPFGRVFHFLAAGMELMLLPMKTLIAGVSKLGETFGGLFGIAKKDAADVVNNDGFNIKAMADIDTEKLSAGISKVKNSLIELGNIEVDGFLAMRSDGVSSSIIMGSEDVITSLKQGKLEVDVKMPKVTMPDINVKVYIGNRELKDIVRTEVSQVLGRAS